MNEMWYVLTQHWDDDCCNDCDVTFFLTEECAISYAVESACKFGADYEHDGYDVKVTYGAERYKYIEIDVKYKDSDERAAWEQYKISKVVPKNLEGAKC